MSKPIGIDLGTTYSAIADWKDFGLVVGPSCYYFPLEERYYIASKIYIPDLSNKDEAQYGKGAIKYYIKYPDEFYSAFKRGMDNNATYERPHGNITSVELSTMLLKHMMKDVVNPVEGSEFIPEGVVVSVPYYFTEPPKQNTCTALLNALEAVYSNNIEYDEVINLRTVQEPIAAGLDYAFSFCDVLSKQNILIFDLGGGTFDVTIYELNNDKINKKLVFTVLATDGDDRLGGEDFDTSIREYILEKNGVSENTANAPEYKQSMALLYLEVTESKCRLSSTSDDTIMLNYFFDRDLLNFRLTDKHIEKILKGEKGFGKIDYLSKIEDIVERCLKKAELKSSMIDRVVLVGGSSNIPCIRKILELKFGKDKMYQSPKPSETVARGACIWAAYQLDLKNEQNPNYKRHLHYWNEIVTKVKTAHSLGVLLANNTVDNLIASNKFTPVSSTRTYFPSSLNPDGTKAELEPLTIKQGNEIIGHIPVPAIYTHGRQKKDILISITLVAEPTNVKVLINVPQGNEDGSDICKEGQIQIL